MAENDQINCQGVSLSSTIMICHIKLLIPWQKLLELSIHPSMKKLSKLSATEVHGE